MTSETPLTITEFWQHDLQSLNRTVGDNAGQNYRILQFRNARGLYTTEKWVFIGDVWMRVSVR